MSKNTQVSDTNHTMDFAKRNSKNECESNTGSESESESTISKETKKSDQSLNIIDKGNMCLEINSDTFLKSTQCKDLLNKSKKNKKKRCMVCNKKLGLMIFTCKCSNIEDLNDKRIFCVSHMHPESHDCTFNHKDMSKELLTKKLVKVINEKVIRI